LIRIRIRKVRISEENEMVQQWIDNKTDGIFDKLEKEWHHLVIAYANKVTFWLTILTLVLTAFEVRTSWIGLFIFVILAILIFLVKVLSRLEGRFKALYPDGFKNE